MTYSAFDITPTARKWVGSFPAPLAGRLRSDRTAHARRVQEILQCLGGGAGAGGFAARGMRAGSRFDPTKISGCVLDLDFTDAGSQTIVTASIVDGSNFATANWYQGSVAIASDFATAPDATTTADKLTAVTTGVSTVVEQLQTNGFVSAGGNPPITAVIYAKYVSCQWLVGQACVTANAGYQVYFDIQNGTVGAVGTYNSAASITSVGNGWFRCTWQLNLSSTTPALRLDLSTTNTTISVPAAGSATLLWGASISQPRVSSILNRASGVPVVQAAAGNQPGFLQSGGINGRASASFFGVSQAMTTSEAAVLSSFQNSVPQTAFGVLTTSTLAGAGVWLCAGINAGTPPYRMYLRNGSSDSFEARPDTGGDVLRNGGTNAWVVNTPYVKEFTYDGTNVEAWVSGASSLPSIAAATSTTTCTRVIIGNWGALNNSAQSGLIGRITSFSRVLSVAERSYTRVGLAQQFAFAVTP